MWRHYVYVHRRADTGAVFYVGKGTVRGRSRVERAFDRSSRNDHWQRVVAKHGMTVEIVASFIADTDAQDFERQLIAEYGRASLTNLTDGGDGCAGISPSPEARARLSAAAMRPRSEAWIASIREARRGGGNGGVVRHGDKLPEWWKARIAAGKIGEKNPMFGRTGAASRQSRHVVDDATGARYASVSEAAAATGAKMKSLYNMLSGHRPNRTTLRFA